MTEHVKDTSNDTQDEAYLSGSDELDSFDLTDDFDFDNDPPFFIVDPQRVKLSTEARENARTYGVLGQGYADSVLDIHALERSIISGKMSVHIEDSRKRLPAKLMAARSQVQGVAQSPHIGRRQSTRYYRDLPKSITQAVGMEDGLHTFFDCLADAPDEVLSDFIFWNLSQVQRVSSERQPELENAKLGFARRMEVAIRRGLPVTQKQLHTRIDDTRMYMVDPMNAMIEQVGGFYLGESRTVHIDASADRTSLNDIATHEFLHLVSGARIERPDNGDDDTDTLFAVVERCGIADKNFKKAATWINEAITEQLSQSLLYKMPADFTRITGREFFEVQQGAYRYERAALWCLLGNRVSIPDMLGAYFEDTTPQNGDTLPLTAKFWGQVEEQFGEGVHAYLASIDYIQTREEYDNFVTGLKQVHAANLLTKGVRNLL